jgi:membrane protein YqaA with SNARE-associated domain
MWVMTQNFFNQYGLFVVFAVAASPLMQHPAIILASLTHTPLTELALVIFSGRLIKYILMGYLASHSPQYLKKFWGMKDELDDVGVKID